MENLIFRKGVPHPAAASIWMMSVLLLVFFIPHHVRAGESALDAGGYVKGLFFLSDAAEDINVTGQEVDHSDPEGTFVSTIRVRLFWQPSPSVSAEIAYELIPRLRDPDASRSFFSVQAANPLTYRFADLDDEVYREGEDSTFRLFQNLDRAFITLSPSIGDIHIGRQPVAFGSARVINPTDVLTSFTYIELNNEERLGVDALRLKIPTGTVSELDGGVVCGEDFDTDESAAFLRGKFFLWNTDLTPMAIVFRQNLLLGLDLVRSIGDAGFWMEGAYTFARLLDGHTSEDDYLRVSTGLDYSFTEDLYGYVEYHYNGAGEGNSDHYGEFLQRAGTSTAYADGAVYLVGKHYLAPGLRYQLTPLVTLGGGAILNVQDGSLLLFPDLHYSLSDNSVIQAGAFIGTGNGPDTSLDPLSGTSTVSAPSEFGLYRDTYFVSFLTYF